MPPPRPRAEEGQWPHEQVPVSFPRLAVESRRGHHAHSRPVRLARLHGYARLRRPSAGSQGGQVGRLRIHQHGPGLRAVRALHRSGTRIPRLPRIRADALRLAQDVRDAGELEDSDGILHGKLPSADYTPSTPATGGRAQLGLPPLKARKTYVRVGAPAWRALAAVGPAHTN